MFKEEILKKIRKVELKAKKQVDSSLQGIYHSLFKGQGLEFQEVREYTDGDDVRLIDWNVTARMNKLFIKKFQEERELTVILLVDISGSTMYGGELSIQDTIASVSATLAFSAIKNNDKVGLLLFSGTTEEFIPPRRGRNHLLTVIRRMLIAKPEGKKTSPDEALKYLNQIMKKKALVFFISDMFFDNFPEHLKYTRRRHEVVPVAIYDKSQFAPFGQGFLRTIDPETGEKNVVDMVSGSKFFEESFKKDVESRFARLKMPTIWIENKEDFIGDLTVGLKRAEKVKR